MTGIERANLEAWAARLGDDPELNPNHVEPPDDWRPEPHWPPSDGTVADAMRRALGLGD